MVNGTPYGVRVLAVNAVGDGTPCVAVSGKPVAQVVKKVVEADQNENVVASIDENEVSEQYKLSVIDSKLVIGNLKPETVVRVCDVLGRMVVNKTANSNSMEVKLNAHGVYILQLQVGTEISTRKFISK